MELIYRLSFNDMSIPYTYTNLYEFLVGAILSGVIVYGIDKLLCMVAYNLTGVVIGYSSGNKSFSKTIHWSIRLLLLVFVSFIITKFIDITFITQCLGRILKVKYEGLWGDFTNQVIRAVQEIGNQ